MDTSLRPQPVIWLVSMEAREKRFLHDLLPVSFRQKLKVLTLQRALRLLAAKSKPALILLESPPDQAAQQALTQLKDIAPDLSVFVLHKWEDAQEMRSWISRCVLEAVQPSPMESLASLNSYKLSNRELEVLRLLVKGLIKKEIAEGLSISYHTVDNHERRIFKKLNVHNRSAAVAKALLEDIV
jgi:DNA-binding CsgD family transcriptional regulator